MDLSTFILTVFCLVDDWLEGREEPSLRSCGLAPDLFDSEVSTPEICGEFLGIDTDEGLFRYFGRHYADECFPALTAAFISIEPRPRSRNDRTIRPPPGV